MLGNKKTFSFGVREGLFTVCKCSLKLSILIIRLGIRITLLLLTTTINNYKLHLKNDMGWGHIT